MEACELKGNKRSENAQALYEIEIKMLFCIEALKSSDLGSENRELNSHSSEDGRPKKRLACCEPTRWNDLKDQNDDALTTGSDQHYTDGGQSYDSHYKTDIGLNGRKLFMNSNPSSEETYSDIPPHCNDTLTHSLSDDPFCFFCDHLLSDTSTDDDSSYGYESTSFSYIGLVKDNDGESSNDENLDLLGACQPASYANVKRKEDPIQKSFVESRVGKTSYQVPSMKYTTNPNYASKMKEYGLGNIGKDRTDICHRSFLPKAENACPKPNRLSEMTLHELTLCELKKDDSQLRVAKWIMSLECCGLEDDTSSGSSNEGLNSSWSDSTSQSSSPPTGPAKSILSGHYKSLVSALTVPKVLFTQNVAEVLKRFRRRLLAPLKQEESVPRLHPESNASRATTALLQPDESPTANVLKLGLNRRKNSSTTMLINQEKSSLDCGVQCDLPTDCRNPQCVQNQDLIVSLKTSIEVLGAEINCLRSEIKSRHLPSEDHPSVRSDAWTVEENKNKNHSLKTKNRFGCLTPKETTTETKLNNKNQLKPHKEKKRLKNKRILKHNKTVENNPSHSPRPATVNFPYIHIESDSHGRHLAGLLQSLVPSTTKVVGVCKPGAKILDVTSGSPPPPRSCCIIIAGMNDVATGGQNNIIEKLEQPIVERLRTSRVVVSTLPRRHDLPAHHAVNEQITFVNSYIEELCKRYAGLELFVFNAIGRRFFTRHGKHLNMKGKALLAKLLLKAVVRVSREESFPTTASTTRTPMNTSPEPVVLPYYTFADAVKSTPPVD